MRGSHSRALERFERYRFLLPCERLSGGRLQARRVGRRRMDPGFSEMSKLSHFDAAGSPRMVDVSGKQATKRTARAHAFVAIRPDVLAQLPNNPKGDPLQIARIAGIMAAKKTSELIPLC